MLPHVADGAGVDLRELQEELDSVAVEALEARRRGVPLLSAVSDVRFPALCALHQGLRDALFMEIPGELRPWVEHMAHGQTPQTATALHELSSELVRRAASPLPEAALRQALAKVLVFESVRLRLLVAAWQSEEFESLGGDEKDVDAIAWDEVEALLSEPSWLEQDIRPMNVMFAAASVSLARDATGRALALRQVGEDLREELRMRARLRGALRELRLPESVLLENALATLLGQDRVELTELQATRPVALAGLTRQAMDQRVSRTRRAMTRDADKWPRRRSPALIDLLQADADNT